MQLPPLGEITWMILQLLPRVLFDPSYALFFWLVGGFVYFQYLRAQRLEENLYGKAFNSALQNTLTALGYGVLGGLVASFVFVLMGATLSQNDVIYVFLLALALMLVNPRLICFSYAGGIIAVSSTLFGWPDVNVPGLLALVAILHVVEGFLVRVSGAQCASPVYVRYHGKNVGGFNMQRFWPIPIMIILAITLPEAVTSGGIQMPDWWPLIPPTGGGAVLDSITYVIAPVVAVLGYGDVAITCSPQEKSRRSSTQLVLFSSVLMILALLTTRWALLGLIAGLFSAGGHELMAQVGSRSQLSGRPYYDQPPAGVRVLEVFPGLFADQLGIKSGDIILEVNGTSVNSRGELQDALIESSFYLELKTQTRDGVVIREHNRYQGRGAQLGLILAPDDGDEPHMELKPMGLLQSILGRWYRGH